MTQRNQVELRYRIFFKMLGCAYVEGPQMPLGRCVKVLSPGLRMPKSLWRVQCCQVVRQGHSASKMQELKTVI